MYYQIMQATHNEKQNIAEGYRNLFRTTVEPRGYIFLIGRRGWGWRQA